MSEAPNKSSKNQTLLKPGEPNHCKFCGSPYGDVDSMAAEIQRLRTALNDIEKLTSSQVTLHYHCRQANVIANLALAGPDDVCVHGKRRDEDCVRCPGSFQKALGHETPVPQWIPVCERRPTVEDLFNERFSGCVLVVTTRGSIDFRYYRDVVGAWLAAQRDGDTCYYTHWMLPPNPPSALKAEPQCKHLPTQAEWCPKCKAENGRA